MPWSKQFFLSFHDLRLHRELLPGEAKCFLCQLLRHTGELEHHAARLDHADPALGRAFTGAHARLGRLLGEALVGEDVDPDLAAALDLARHRDTSRLDLAVRDPAGVHGLEAVVAELHRGLAPRLAATASAVDLPELRLLRHQHQSVFSCDGSPDWSSFVGSSCICFCVVVSGASATGASTVSTCGSITGCSRPSAEVPVSSVRGCSTTSPRGAAPPPAPRPRPRPRPA